MLLRLIKVWIWLMRSCWEIPKSKHYRQIKLPCHNYNYLHSNNIVNRTKSIWNQETCTVFILTCTNDCILVSGLLYVWSLLIRMGEEQISNTSTFWSRKYLPSSLSSPYIELTSLFPFLSFINVNKLHITVVTNKPWNINGTIKQKLFLFCYITHLSALGGLPWMYSQCWLLGSKFLPSYGKNI